MNTPNSKRKARFAFGWLLGLFVVTALLIAPIASLKAQTSTSTDQNIASSTTDDTSSATSTDTDNSSVASSTDDNNTATSTDTSNASATSTTENETATGAASSTPVTIMVMKHLCPANITNISQFNNIQNGTSSSTATGTASTTVGAFAVAEWACPTSVLPSNTPSTGSVSSAKTNFDYTVSDGNGHSVNLSQADFIQNKVCEAGIGMDLNGDGNISASTCLDASFYRFTGLTGNNITISETNPSEGHHFGTVLFTPSSLDGNNDSSSFVSQSFDQNSGTGSITLDVANDTDKMIMLHQFDFADTGSATSTTSSPAITLSGNSTMTITQGQTFTDPGATATDVNGTNLTSQIVVTGGPVNTSNVGTTVLTYRVTGANGMSATVTRTVIVQSSGNGGSTSTTTPTIILNGNSTMTVTQGQAFTDPGATATDVGGTNLTSQIVVTGGPVNTSNVGTTTLTYTITNSAGQRASVTRTVIVQASGTGTGTGTTTPGTLSDQTLIAFTNIIQRVQDIQSRILDLLAQLISR